MVKIASKSDIAWSYLAQSLNLGAGLLLLPPILHYLNPEDVGLWFVFITLSSLAQLLELGFQPTLARNATYVYSGAKKLTQTGIPELPKTSFNIDQELLINLIEAGKKIYRKVSIHACLALFFGGSAYITSLEGNEKNITNNLIAWILFSSGSIITFYFGYYNGLLLGRGDIAPSSKVTAATRSSLIILGSISVVCGFGLIGLGASSLISSIIGRYISRSYFNKQKIQTSHSSINIKLVTDITKTLRHNAYKQGAVQLGAFFVIRGNILVATSYLGLAESASYSITINIFTALIGISIVAFQLQMPYLTSLQIRQQQNKIPEILGSSILMCWIIFLLGAIFTIIYGSQLITMIGSRTNILPNAMLLALSTIFLLELNHSISATFLTSQNQVPFLKPSLASGALVLILSTLFVRYYGLWAPILSQGAVQLIYNNWKWPKETSKTLNMKYTEIIIAGAKNIKFRVR